MMGPFEHVDRVHLDEPQPSDQTLNRGRTAASGGRGGEALGGEQDPPSLPGGDLASG